MKEIKAFIEIPAGSRYKYELDKDSNQLILDRPLNQEIPYNYGFIPNTLCGDGDPLDVFIISKYPLTPGTFCKIKILGALICEDNGKSDDKLIAKLQGEDIELNQKEVLDKIQNYLLTYKTGFNVIRQAYTSNSIKLLKDAYIAYDANVIAEALFR